MAFEVYEVCQHVEVKNGEWEASDTFTNVKVKAGESYVIRFKSEGNFERHFDFNDLVRGKLSLPQNDEDLVNLYCLYKFIKLLRNIFLQNGYKVGLLNYSSTKMWRRMFKAAKGKKI